MRFKLMLALLWAAVIVVATCNNDAEAFLFDQEVQFSLTAAPEYSDLLILSDIDFTDDFYFLQKTGHFLSFALLFVLLYTALKSRKTAFYLSAAFALFTEVLQLYFERDGRLFDVLIDVAGAFFALALVNVLLTIRKTSAEDSF